MHVILRSLKSSCADPTTLTTRKNLSPIRLFACFRTQQDLRGVGAVCFRSAPLAVWAPGKPKGVLQSCPQSPLDVFEGKGGGSGKYEARSDGLIEKRKGDGERGALVGGCRASWLPRDAACGVDERPKRAYILPRPLPYVSDVLTIGLQGLLETRIVTHPGLWVPLEAV